MQKMNFVGLDVHARKIAIAVDGYGGLKSLGNIPHDLAKLKRVLKKTGRPEDVHVFYEAGPTGYGLCRSLRTMGYHCDVVAPSLIPSMSGDRVKTDRRDAEKLAQLGRANLLTSVWVPGVHQEALRDLVRAREAAMRAQKTAGQQLDKFLLRHGRRPDEKMTKWTAKYLTWVRTQRFVESAQQVVLEELIAEYDHQRERLSRIERHMHVAAEKLPEQSQATVRALVALKGVRFLTAITLVSEIGDMMRFSHPTQLMSYTGVVPAEHSSGDSVRRGPITKAGNAHLRRIVGEAAWSYARGISTPSAAIKKRREGLSPAIVLIAERADQRLRSRYRRLAARGKHKNKIATAIARELLGFVWAIGVQAQLEATQSESRAAA
jgi:transposase